jgi:phage N-6-adenine-methyltransferase
MINKGMMSSRSGDWETPLDVFLPLYREFSLGLDVCATSSTAKCDRYIDQDSLDKDWHSISIGCGCWMNPPYGNGIGAWVKKAYVESTKGATVCCLLPARTDTAWWHDYCMRGEIRFIRGRLCFGGKGPAPFPSAVVIFKPPITRTLLLR